MISFCKRLSAFVTRLPATSFALSSLSTALLAMPATSFAAGADYDGNGFSEIPVITQGSDGTYTWNLFDPISGKSTVFTSRFGRGGESIILANWLYPTVTSAGVLSAPTVHSAGRLVWTIRTTVVNKGRRGGAISKIQQHTKYLGRTGDIIVTGGDFDGDRVADAVVITNRGTGLYKLLCHLGGAACARPGGPQGCPGLGALSGGSVLCVPPTYVGYGYRNESGGVTSDDTSFDRPASPRHG